MSLSCIKRLLPFLLVAIVAALVGPHTAFTQNQGGRGGNGGRRGPDFFFDRFSGGSDTFDVDSVVIPDRMLRPGETGEQKREQWRTFLQKNGVTNGKMTRGLFRAFFNERTGRPAQPREGAAGTAGARQPGGRGGRRGPDFFFDRFSGGSDTFDVDSVVIPDRMLRPGESAEQKREQWRAFLKENGATDGKMTRELFSGFFAKQTGRPASPRESSDGGQSSRPRPGGGNGGRGADFYFDRYAGGAESFDVETVDIPPRMIRPGETAEQKREQWRTFLKQNGVTDGKMTREQFRAFFAKQTGRPATSGSATVAPPSPSENDEGRPTVYRVGKLPKGLPSWFSQLDRDNDGQVGLYEWKAAGRSTSEFLAMDANGDGFLTAEEVLRFQKAQKKGAPATTVSRKTGNGATGDR
jgi:hypothetical protein